MTVFPCSKAAKNYAMKKKRFKEDYRLYRGQDMAFSTWTMSTALNTEDMSLLDNNYILNKTSFTNCCKGLFDFNSTFEYAERSLGNLYAPTVESADDIDHFRNILEAFNYCR